MQQKTSIIITVTTAILIAVVFYLSGKPKNAPPPIGAESTPPNEVRAIARSLAVLDRPTKPPPESNPESQTIPTIPKLHGCAKGNFQVIENLPPKLHTPVFRPGVVYPLWARFSSNNASLDDTQAAVQTLSIKLLDVAGEKYFGETSTHDFVLRSHPVFPYADAASFADAIEAFEKGQPLTYFFNPLRLQIKAWRIHKASRQKHQDLLAIDWWSALPYRYGQQHAVKYALRPCSQSSANKHHFATGSGADFLRERLAASLGNGPACFDFLVQFQTSAALTPVEDSSVLWDETIAPFEPIARVNFPAQTIGPDEISHCRRLAMHPWRTIPAHRPLGGINRVLREIYPAAVRIKDL